MTIDKQLDFLIKELLPSAQVPETPEQKWQLFRSLVNTRNPQPASAEFLEAQDGLLKKIIRQKGITDISDLQPIKESLYLWQGDITTLQVDAIVNAANSKMLGCFVPCHSCIDNAIHTFAGVQLRLECDKIMCRQGYDEPTGKAKITKAYNLSSKHILHTVGPIITGKLTEQDCKFLADCYRSCLMLAIENGLKSIAFCCISTGEFHFPNDEAAKIAVSVVRDFIKTNQINIIFNVFKDIDRSIYNEILR